MSPAPNRSRRHGGCESTWHGTAVVSSGEVCGECGHSVLESIAHAKWYGDMKDQNIRMGCSLRGHPGSSMHRGAQQNKCGLVHVSVVDNKYQEVENY